MSHVYDSRRALGPGDAGVAGCGAQGGDAPDAGRRRDAPDAPGFRGGAPTLCNFEYSGTLVEHNLLGTVAFRAGKKLQWDAENLKAPNCPEADRFIRRPYREGWTL